MKIVWTDEAIDHLEAIVTYVSVYDPAAAERLGRRLIELADSLAEFPNRGRDAGEGRREERGTKGAIKYSVPGIVPFGAGGIGAGRMPCR